jgi:DNA-binding Lrp family transcriptional regulator
MTEAFVLVQAEPRTLPIAARLGAVHGVREVHDVSGPYDALAVADSDGRAQLEELLEKIRAIPGVLRALAAPISATGSSAGVDAAA